MKKRLLGTAARFIMAGAVVGMSHVGMAAEWQKPVYVPSDGASKGARVTYVYKDDSLFRVNTKIGFVNDIELKPGEVVTHIAGGDTKRWLIDKAVVGNVQHVYIKPIEPDIDTNIIINTNQRAYRLYVVASDDYDPLVSFTFPDEPSARRLRVPEDRSSLYGRNVNRNYEIRVKKKADKSLIPLEIFDDGRQTFIRMSKDNKYDLPVLYSIDPWNKKNVAMVNYRVDGDYFVADGVFPQGRLFYQQKFWIDFFNLEKKATVKGTFPANRQERMSRNRVVYDDAEEEEAKLARREKERIAREKEKERAAYEKALAIKAREREKQVAKARAEEERRLASLKKEQARRQELARREEAARAEALRRQQAARQEEAIRRQQMARQQAAREEQLRRQEEYRRRVQEAQQQEDLRRQKLAEEQAAADKAYARDDEPAQYVPGREDEEAAERPVDGTEKEKLFWEAVRRQQVYDRMYSDYKKKKAGESE